MRGKMNKKPKTDWKEVNDYITYCVKLGWIDDEAENWTDEQKLDYYLKSE